MNWLLQLVREQAASFSAGLEEFYKIHSGLVALLGLAVALLGAHYGRLAISPRGSKNRSAPALDLESRTRLLNRIQTERVAPRLRQGLREAIRVDLGLTETPGAVPARLVEYSRLESGGGDEHAVSVDIQALFQKANERMLILGEPGTGKTNLLLELARSLIAKAKDDPTIRVPVVFSLPRWALSQHDRPIVEWLKDDLAAEYGVSRAFAEIMVQEDRILPLLDGLDEVDESRRVACVEAIQTYQAGRNLGPLAVCCRLTEYQQIPKLDLSIAIRVEKLNRADVEREIHKPGMEYARRALDADPELWALVDTPLWLHVLYRAAQVDPPSGLQNANMRDRLYTRYVEYALQRTTASSPRGHTSRDQLLHWLASLATEMGRRNQSQFAFEGLDFSWVAHIIPARAMEWIMFLVAGLATGMVGSFVNDLNPNQPTLWGLSSKLVGILGGLTGTIFVALTPEDWGLTEPVEELELSLPMTEIIWTLVITLFTNAIVFAFSEVGRPGFATPWGYITVASISVLFLWLHSGLKPRAVSRHSRPNLGTQRSLRYSCWIGFIGLLFAGLALVAKQEELPSLPPFLAIIGLALGWAKGGFFALRHYTVRLLLAWSGFAPLAYVDFLQEAKDRLFLISRGGSYEFLHPTFREFMARSYSPKSNGPH